jgi:para-aminobenzoate synthetase component I
MKMGIGQLPQISSLFMEEIDLGMPFELAAGKFAQDPGTVLLLSGSNGISSVSSNSGSGSDPGSSSRFNILGVHPWLELKCRGETLSLRVENKVMEIVQDPFIFLDRLLTHLNLDKSVLPKDSEREMPVYAGLFGYFAYDLKDRIEHLPRTCVDTHLPDISLYAPSMILLQDRQTKKNLLCIPVLSNCASDKNDYIQGRKDAFLKQLAKPLETGLFSMDDRGFKSSFSKPEYIRAVEKIIQYLRAGDIYQANLSQRFETGFKGDAYALFLELFNRNPAAFFSYIHAGDHKIVSTSPERFIKLDGKQVETRPIKGTIARGNTLEQDQENGQHLVRSIKDDAELTMIVDLMRNDLSRVARAGSVEVSEHKRLESYANVFHLVSIVTAELSEGKTAVDLLRATFPGGSITGCPKIRSMEIIDELESVRRHVYTGAIGYISFHNTMDLSIAIRTATIVDQTLFFSVGGGIVYDSDPYQEFQETLDKGKTLMDTLSAVSSEKSSVHPKAWVDGKMVDQDQAMVSAQSLGFQYGAGLFETIRVEKGTPVRLGVHLQRMNGAWTSLFGGLPPDITWEHVIDRIILENDFRDKICAVKLIISRDEQANGKQAFLAAFARPYVHRLVLSGKTGLDLVTFPKPRSTPMADHKTLNYLYYERAGAYASSQKADEALILNPDFSVSETNTANIFAIHNKEIILPSSDHVLPGVTLNAVIDGLTRLNFTVSPQKLTARELASCPNIFVTNSLMDAVKVLHIDGEKIDHDNGMCEKINQILAKR